MNFLGMKIQSSIIRSDYFLFSHLSRFLNHVPGSHVWKLCYRASSHSWDASTLFSYCDGKRHTVTIIRKNQYVFGGYTDIPWGMCAMYEVSHHREHTILLSREKERVDNGTKRMNSLALSSLFIYFIVRDFTGKTAAYKSCVTL